MARLDRATRSGTEASGNLAICTWSFGININYRAGPGDPVKPGHDDDGQESIIKRAGIK